MILVTTKLMIKVLFNERMVDMHFNKVRFNVFYLIVKRVVTNFKRPIKHLIKLYLHENDVKLLKCKWSPIKFDLWYVWSVRFWSWIPEINTSSKAMESLTCFSLVNLILGSFLFKKFKKFIEFCSLSKAARISTTSH